MAESRRCAGGGASPSPVRMGLPARVLSRDIRRTAEKRRWAGGASSSSTMTRTSVPRHGIQLYDDKEAVVQKQRRFLQV